MAFKQKSESNAAARRIEDAFSLLFPAEASAAPRIPADISHFDKIVCLSEIVYKTAAAIGSSK